MAWRFRRGHVLGAVYRRNLGLGGSRHQPQLPGVIIPQTAFLPGELGLSSPGPLSPSGVKSASQYYPSYPSNPRRRAADGGLGELELGTCVCKGRCDLDWRPGWVPLGLGGHRGQSGCFDLFPETGFLGVALANLELTL